MTHFEGQENWMTKNNIFFAPWYEKYIWSYYFGITIILTIGFGDLHATNYIEAFVIITISFFAVVFFGYNINYIGNRINSIREDEMEKNGKLKVFSTLAKKTQVPKELRTEITTTSWRSAKSRRYPTSPRRRNFCSSCPALFGRPFLQEANKQLFTNLLSLVSFSKKTIEALSEAIEMKICHPE